MEPDEQETNLKLAQTNLTNGLSTLESIKRSYYNVMFVTNVKKISKVATSNAQIHSVNIHK